MGYFILCTARPEINFGANKWLSKINFQAFIKLTGGCTGSGFDGWKLILTYLVLSTAHQEIDFLAD